MDTVYLQLDTAMVDPAPIYKLAEYYQLPAPTAPIRNHDWRPQWRKNIAGLRALRVLKEISPFLLGEKLREAERALDFFSPFGNHRGCYRNGDIWPRAEFPLRSKRRGSNFLAASDNDQDETVEIQLVNSSQMGAGLSRPTDMSGTIIPTLEGRSWVGGFVQGEGSTLTHYVRSNDYTVLVLMVTGTDPAPILEFSDLVGLPRPLQPKPNREQRPKWWRETTGLRAVQVLREIQPFLVGEKLREVEKALILFSPSGYRKGCHRAADVWPSKEFPLRNHRAGLGSTPESSHNDGLENEA
jgi:hypothetical protein